MGIIWNGQEVKIYFHPQHLQRHVSCKSICSPCISCPNRVCDNTSFFSGTGKKSSYLEWAMRPDLTTTICHLMERPLTLSSEDVEVIESFIVSLHSLTCPLTEVNKARQQIFSQSSHTFEYLSSTKAESNLSSWICVGAVSCDRTSLTKSRLMGMG